MLLAMRGNWSGKNMKKNLIIGIICASIFISAAAFYVFVVSGAFAVFAPNPPKPEITYGEFPFTITYEVGDEIFTYKDVVVCEYNGIKSLGTAGKRRNWSIKLKSGNQYISLLKSKKDGLTFEIYESIPGLPEYYMGDFRQSRAEYERVMKDRRYLGYKQKDIDRSITKEEAWEKYRVKIINIECSLPIENKFE